MSYCKKTPHPYHKNMIEGIKLRRIRYKDIHDAGSLVRETIRTSYPSAYPPRAVDFFLNYHRNKAIRKRAVDGFVIVAEQNGDIVATGSIMGNEITGVFVKPDLQGKGIGGIVMDKLEELAVQSGCGHVVLSISLPSRSFYEKKGYEITGAARIDVGMGQFLEYWEGKKTFGKSQNTESGAGSQKTGGILVEEVLTQTDLDELDSLLWEVLWRPVGLPRDIRQSFHLEGPCREFCVRSKKGIAAGIVVRRTSAEEVEICHIAVAPEMQRQGIGLDLVECVINMAREENCSCIRVIARNTSAGFFKKIGFSILPQTIPDHPAFKKQGITFLLMEMPICAKLRGGTGSQEKAGPGSPVMTMETIGVIHSPFRTKEDCPIQPLHSSEALGHVEVFEKYEAGLKDIETFSHIYLFYRFDKAGDTQMERPTFLDDASHGVFATRHPYRPNNIGMSVVKLIRRDKNILEVEGIDVLDNTPLLDIKPYIPRFDRIDTANEGWVADMKWRPKPSGRE